jgi:hypothetical protein
LVLKLPAGRLRARRARLLRRHLADGSIVALPHFRRPHYLLLAFATALVVAISAGFFYINRTPAAPQLMFSEFLQRVDAGNVTQVTFGDRSIEVGLRDGSKARTVAPPEFLNANSSFFADLVKRQIKEDVVAVDDPATRT